MKQWYALYVFLYSYSNEDNIPVLPECICNKWQNMMQKHLRHTTKEKMVTMGKVDTSDLMMIIIMTAMCLLQIHYIVYSIYLVRALSWFWYRSIVPMSVRLWDNHDITHLSVTKTEGYVPRTIVLQQHSKKSVVCCHLSLTGIDFNPSVDTQLHMPYNLSPPLKFGNVLISNFISPFRCWDKS